MVRIAKLVAALTALTMVFGAVMAFKLAHDLREARAAYAQTVGSLDHDTYRPPHTGPSDLQRALTLANLSGKNELHRLVDAERWSDAATPGDDEALATLLADNAEALRAARDAAVASASGNGPVWWLHPSIDPLEPMAQESLSLVRYARLLHLAAVDSQNRGDLDAAVQYSDATGLLGAALAEQPVIIAAIFANTHHGLHLRTVRSLAVDPRCRAACLDALAGSLARTPPRDPAKILAAEGAWLIGQTWPQTPEPAGWRFLLFGGTRDEVFMLDRWRGLVEATSGPYEALDTHLVVRDPDGGRHAGVIIADIYIPNIVDILYKAKRLQVAHDLARTAIAARRSALEAGTLPATLDPSTISTAARVTYQRLDDGSAQLAAPGVTASLASDRLDRDHSSDPRLFAWTLPAP